MFDPALFPDHSMKPQLLELCEQLGASPDAATLIVDGALHAADEAIAALFRNIEACCVAGADPNAVMSVATSLLHQRAERLLGLLKKIAEEKGLRRTEVSITIPQTSGTAA